MTTDRLIAEADARRTVNEHVKFPQGFYAICSGQFEYMERV
jgi:Cu/Ag efflux pump CusA